MTQYFVRPSWHRPGWFAVCYNNSAQTPTLYGEALDEGKANHIAEVLNQTSTSACGLLPSQILGGEMLTYMNDEALKQVYHLLVELKQHTAAGCLAHYAKAVAQVDLGAK
jgi:hypothetical protein